jgi:hypothetical protein
MKSAEVIGWALGGIEREIGVTRERLKSLTAQANQLRAKLGKRVAAAAGLDDAGGAEAGNGRRRRRRRKMSAEARKRISELMRKRWADRKKKGHTKL